MGRLIFVGTMQSAPFNPEERRLVEELRLHFQEVAYLYGVGIRGLKWDSVWALRRKWRRFREAALAENLPIYRPLKIVPPRGLMQGVNVRWLRRQICNVTGPETNDWTFWTRFPSPELVAAVQGLSFSRVIYEPVDRYAAHPYYSREERNRITAAEKRLSKHSLVLASSSAVARELGGYWLPLGIESADQQDDPPFATLATAGPRLLVMGSLDWRLDQELLTDVAQRHPTWQLVLAGPVSVEIRTDLKRLPNVHWLGGVPPAQARSVIRDCDVALIPYILTDWTRACLPLKAFDYLAAGKPVVSTPLPELLPFADVVRLATPLDFTGAILDALREPLARREQGLALCREFVVEKRVDRIMRLLATT